MKRPRGITIVAVILALLGLVSVLFGGLAAVAAFAGNGTSGIDPDQVTLVGAVGIAYLLMGAAQIFVAWALWGLKRWAWWLTVILQGISVLEAAAAMAFTEVTRVDAAIFPSLVISLVILGYFLTGGVRRSFGYGPTLGLDL